MEESYEQHTSAIGSLRSILHSYPFSVGILRELLQNSDDAGAKKQVFVLDHRSHPVASLNHPKLASTQGPALLAYNDALFNEADWESLKHAFESSKSDDSSKIGKYGIGFRSVYHFTDCPQILSGSYLTISDPLKSFTDSYGKRIDIPQSFNNITDQLSSFDWFLNHGWNDTIFEGTIIRCPLRTIPSKISGKTVCADEISQLFRDFVKDEIDISLLFLQNLTSIEIYEVNEQGKSTCMATSLISRSAPSACGDRNENKAYKASVSSNVHGKEQERVWRILHCPFSQEEAVQHLAKRRIYDPSSTLKEQKLIPTVSLAVPLTIATQAETRGRLFTFLPLPLKTGFPAHVHALFAVTQSRQHLRNSGETGIVSQADDHVVIEWNKLLFNEFIPRAWKNLLEVLVQADGIINVFHAWPDKQPTTLSGDTVYWQSLPTRLLHFVVSSQSPVWPVYSFLKDSPTEYKALDRLMTSQPVIRETVLRSLTTMGLELTRPPLYLVDEIRKLTDPKYVVLTPEAAHFALLELLAGLTDIPQEDTFVVLEYLLSTDNVLNIIGLPFIKTVSGQVAALVASTSNPSKTYTMLDRVEFDVFGSCDDDSIIVLKEFPSPVSKSLQSHGPKFINVENLGSKQIVQYLTLYPNRLGLDLSLVRTDPRAVKWLSIFWVWMSTYSDRADLYPKIKHLYLLPSTRGLKTAETALFKSRGEHPLNVQHLASVGIAFLDADVTSAAQTVIASESYKLLKSINDIHTLLDSLPSDTSNLSLSKEAPPTILRFISTHAPAACASRSSMFSEEQIQRLKGLPIYPIFVSSDTIIRTSIPDGYSIRAISKPTFLPVIERIVFVEAQLLTFPLLGYLEPNNPEPLSDAPFLELVFDHFIAQTDSLQASVLQYLIRRRHSLPPSLLHHLVDIAFVVSIDGLKRKPREVIDPSSPIACLYERDPTRQVRTANDPEQSIVGSLHSMQLMQHSLTTPMVEERIKFISANHSSAGSIDLSRSLLAVIRSTHFDCSHLPMVPGQKWLPTNKGLCVPEECRDGVQNQQNLFDEVLAVLEQGIQIPSSLRTAFGWDKAIEIKTIIEQFNRVLNKSGDIHEKVVDIIKELSGRDCGSSNLVTLRSITAERKWVPTANGQLARTIDAVFSCPIVEAGFEQILPINPNARKFLLVMGCSETPSLDAVLTKLNNLSDAGHTLATVSVAVSLLSILPSKMSDEERAAVLIPDVDCILRPFSEIYFNDIAEHASLIPTENHFIAHHQVHDTLARKLNLARLGLKFVDLNIPGVDMGEKPLTTVRNTLRQYPEKQFVIEFVANACDANATKLTLLINEVCSTVETPRLLSPSMQKFSTCPSLVIYNNEKFTDQDFKGICQTSIGGKEGKSNTIGQFGLGALTMFHITELAIIVSNADVLFLNPSKEHLPTSNRAALKLPLNHIRRFYPDHISSINGLFGFDASSTDPYEGTIFILPLRNLSHCTSEHECASNMMWTANDIQDKILKPFEEAASNCLLFTKIEEFCSIVRNANCDETVSWSIKAERIQDQVEEKTEFSTTKVNLSYHTTSQLSSRSWKIASATTHKSQIPATLLSALDKQYRLRLPPTIGLAVSLDDPPPKPESFRFFSTLPLPVQTMLPVHIMASFALSPDRRYIRLDESNNPETEYNRWLLSSMIPPLYLFLLETLSSGENKQWWPGRRPQDIEPTAKVLVNAFFSTHLKATERRVFHSMFNPSLSLGPKDCVLFDSEPSSIKKVLMVMRSDRLVKLPTNITRRAVNDSGVARVDSVFLRNEILRDTFVIPSVPMEELEELIDYLSKTKNVDKATDEDPAQKSVANLIGLPLLPLADGTFGVFRDKGCPISEFYFVWTSRGTSERSIFPLSRLVHPQFKVKPVLKLDLNVSLLSSDAVKAFITARLPQSRTIPDADHERIQWIQDFWNEYPFEPRTTPADLSDIFEFPLVPTIRPRCYVSLEECSRGSTLIVRGDSQEQLWDCLDRLGLTVVHADNQPENLTHILGRTADFPDFKFERILSAINVEFPTISERFLNLDANSQWIFASWARTQICSFADDLSLIAQELPIWEVARPESELELRAASEIYMLPEGLRIETAARFLNCFVAEWGNLNHLKGPKLTFAELDDHLDLPAVLRPVDLLPYKELLTIWVNHLPYGYGRPLPVPNSNGEIMPSNLLYAREELFEAAFGVDSVKFLAIEFQELENTLYRYGLQGENGLDMIMFTACAEAIHDIEEDAEDKVQRAAIVFRAYCIDLPLRVDSDAQQSWSRLDNLRFIPRNMDPKRRLEHHEDRRMSLDIPQHLQDLPDVVSPNELVRKEFESIAWTQRASFLAQPHQRVLMTYPDLGRPLVTEVISHLRALSSLTVQGLLQRQVFIHDMKETLKWLNDNVEGSEDSLYDLRHEDIFLNVDDPSSDSWIWANTNQLVFGGEDIHAALKPIRYVRKFLLPYDKLLRAAGAIQVNHPQYPISNISESHMLKLIRTGFNDLRQKGRWTDVVFVTNSNDIDPPLVAHRSFLAVLSNFFSASFCGEFSEAQDASSSNPIMFPARREEEVYYSASCVQLLLDHTYTGSEPSEDSKLELLLEAMELSDYWMLTHFFEDVQRTIIKRRLIDPLTLDDIRASAERVKATVLLQYCQEYENENAEYIERLHSL